MKLPSALTALVSGKKSPAKPKPPKGIGKMRSMNIDFDDHGGGIVRSSSATGGDYESKGKAFVDHDGMMMAITGMVGGKMKGDKDKD